MIKAIIFDCFGVLVTDGWKAIREEFVSDIDRTETAHALDVRVNAGLMDYDDFIKQVAKLSGLTTQEVRSRINDTVPNQRLFDYIKRDLKPDYKIGLLSNVNKGVIDELLTNEQLDLFDEKVLSFERGYTKPDARIYQDILNKLTTEPEEAVFTDDIERYCVAAEDLGVKSIQYKDFDSFYKSLNKILEK